MVAVLMISFAGSAMAARVACDGGKCTGTRFIDVMTGSNRIDRMYGLGGNDRMTGGYNNDVMSGAGGSDNMDGSFGYDRLYGGSSADVISGGLAHDRIFAGPGVDTVNGNAGNDYIVIAGDNRDDSVDCGTGHDVLVLDLDEMTPPVFADFVRQTSCEDPRVRP